MFLYLMLRAKAFRMALWVVFYYITSSLKKYSVHVFFWQLPGLSKKRIGWAHSALRVSYKRLGRVLPTTKIGIRILPTNYYLGGIWKSQKNPTKCIFTSQNTWEPARLMFRYWSKADSCSRLW